MLIHEALYAGIGRKVHKLGFGEAAVAVEPFPELVGVLLHCVGNISHCLHSTAQYLSMKLEGCGACSKGCSSEDEAFEGWRLLSKRIFNTL